MARRPAPFLAALLLAAGSLSPAGADPDRPDLIIDPGKLAADWTVGLRYFLPGDCSIVEGCILAPGWRKLLVFSIQTANISKAPLSLGDPTSSPYFEFSACHGHYHLVDFSDYDVTTLSGSQVSASQKTGWCLIDVERYLNEPWVPSSPSYSCSDQGISPVWSDIYESGLDCQWVDVTDVAPGDYLLNATVNARRRIHESNFANNTSTIPVTIPDLSVNPDFVVDGSRIASTLQTTWRIVSSGDSLLADGCVASPGLRRLMRFSFDLANIAPDDSALGSPFEGSPYFEFPPSNPTPHLRDFLEYTLLDAQGSAVVPPSPQEFFFPSDTAPYLAAPWVRAGHFYGANVWGLQRGWSSRVPSNLRCQWVDVTNLPSGAYDLKVEVNPRGAVPEAVRSNNATTVPIVLQENRLGVAHRPDGYRILGSPLRVEPAPAGLRLIYDVVSCPAPEYNVYYSALPPSSYGISGALCNVGATGDVVLPIPDPPIGKLVWLVVVGRDSTREGGAGFDSEGRIRSISGIPQCGLTTPDPTSMCAPSPQ